ncbi:MAG TPA: MvaI/BcnI family restriction endonuclease [Mucilaginibacter sp.]|nr:MvaI/BcnI family restriction endonuclease [Mucilaginibacter sp.]
MDATGPVRGYLKEKGLHDYSAQKQGEAYKVFIKAYLVNAFKTTTTQASLYRPKSKKGDPRIWFKKLPEFAKPNDILVVLAFHEELFVINLTQTDIVNLIDSPLVNPVKELVDEIRSISNFVANELLLLLQNIAGRGPIPGMLKADTSIGRTLETLLGISINSSKKPDYKGIELKSYRDKKANRKNLFAQVAEWPLSKFKSSAEILDAFGYPRGSDFKLYCTVSTLVRNSQGLSLKINQELQQLIEHSDKLKIGDFACWTLDILHKRLLEKHAETFWIAADTIIDSQGLEHFQYKKVLHTRKPITSQFDILLEQGLITMDHLIKRSPDGKVVEKGPLFKIKPKAIDLLFPPSQIYNLI